MAVGILAFGSLLADPGAELARLVVRRVEGVLTPFAVEFARSSRTRSHGPTLVPVESGGASVPAVVLVLATSVDEMAARDLLHRRESRRSPRAVPGDGARAGWIRTTPAFDGLSTCLYAALPGNISPLTPARLTELAIASAQGPAGADRRDGISYLDEQKRRGVTTPLMPRYERLLLERTGASDLRDAWRRARAAGRP